MKYLFLDLETTGFLAGKDLSNPNQPHIVQLAAMLTNDAGEIQQMLSLIVTPNGQYKIPVGAANVHGIPTERATEFGQDPMVVLSAFHALESAADMVVCHNVNYDKNVLHANYIRYGFTAPEKAYFCTMSTPEIVAWCAIPPTSKMISAGRIGHKVPNLSELHNKCFGESFSGAHNAIYDVRATKNCFFEMKKQGVI